MQGDVASQNCSESKLSKRSSVWYEQFVRDIHQSLMNQDSIVTIRVEHNVKIIGRSGASHQIDVFWQFEVAGQRYQTCVECKEYNSKVKKSHVAAFAAILADIGNVNGIFVTTEGYQQGAKQFATDRHIRLLILNPTIRRIEINLVCIVPEYRNVQVKPDPKGSRDILLTAGRDKYSACYDGSVDIFTGSGERVCSLNELVRKLPSREGHNNHSLAGYFMNTEIGMLPLGIIEYDLKHHEINQPMTINAEDAVKAVLEDVLNNTQMYINEDGTTAPANCSDELQ
jgi:hypothetical protein